MAACLHHQFSICRTPSPSSSAAAPSASASAPCHRFSLLHGRRRIFHGRASGLSQSSSSLCKLPLRAGSHGPQLFQDHHSIFGVGPSAIGRILHVPLRAASAERDDITNRTDEDTSSSDSCDPLCSVDEMSSLDFEANYKPKTDLLKAVTIVASVLTGAAVINHSWVAENQDLAMVLVFVLGYAGIVFEESLAFNKSGVGLLMAVTLWVIHSVGAPSTDETVRQLTESSAEVSEIVFFLLGAMTIVEIIDAHQGFKLITNSISTRKPQELLWVVYCSSFFLAFVCRCISVPQCLSIVDMIEVCWEGLFDCPHYVFSF